MDLPSRQVHKILVNNEVDELHHANSVVTACHFLRSKALLARGNIERLGWGQTPQSSDKKDRIFSLWHDVFLDSVDIHARASGVNHYGPVLFVFDVSILRRNGTGRLWVTKRNPTDWTELTREQRWFKDIDELREEFVVGEFAQSIVLRHTGGELPFGKYLKKIVLDDPNKEDEDGVDYFSMAVGALRYAMQVSRLNIEIERRECSKHCRCSNSWRNRQRLSTMFSPTLQGDDVAH